MSQIIGALNADYTVIVYDENWDKSYFLSDFQECSFTFEFNSAGSLILDVLPGSDFAEIIDVDYKIELYRTPPHHFSSLTYSAWSGKLEEQKYIRNEVGVGIYRYTFISSLGLLQRVINAHYAGTTDKSKFINKDIDFIIEEVVDSNTWNGTTGNGRLRNSDFTDLNHTFTPFGSAISIDFGCAWRNVYDIIVQLAAAGGHNVALIPNSVQNRWDLEIDEFIPGSDLTDNIILSVENGTIDSIEISVLDITNKTVGIVGGENQGSDRETAIVLGDEYSVTNSSELFIDARGSADAGELSGIGDARLKSNQTVKRFSISLNQNELYLFGDGANYDFFVGDTIGLWAHEVLYSVKVERATHNLRVGQPETLRLECIQT